jgi:hypothetical protein
MHVALGAIDARHEHRDEQNDRDETDRENFGIGRQVLHGNLHVEFANTVKILLQAPPRAWR